MGNTNDTGGEWLDLVDAIALLRAQVVEAQRQAAVAGADEGVEFVLGEITVDFGMELTNTKGVDGGLRWSVIGFGGRKENSRAATHTVSVTLNPQLTGGGNVKVRDDE
ncbi:trypco2 family protein [Streptomyces sp. NPDC090301]|uniref:trypco2 family protein n=1 Tax=Streptomyces sp. NPDC090301 TaxID=3154975 RepID=UPI0034339D1C